jgi:hypothetical protein
MVPTPSDPPVNLPTVESGVYESLLTARLHQALNASTDQVLDLQDVDEVEQPLVIARHLASLIERALQAARTAEARIPVEPARASWSRSCVELLT